MMMRVEHFADLLYARYDRLSVNQYWSQTILTSGYLKQKLGDHR